MKQYNHSKVNKTAFLLWHHIDTTMVRLYTDCGHLQFNYWIIEESAIFLGSVIWCNEPTPATSVDLSDHPKGLLKYV